MKQSRALSHLGHLLVLFLLAGAFAPAAAQLATDSWAPHRSQPPVELRVVDPVHGNITFPPVHATLLPDGRVMLISRTGVHARAAWFLPGPLNETPPPSLLLTPDHVPVRPDLDLPREFDYLGLHWHLEETLFCSGHALMADGSIFVAGGTYLWHATNPAGAMRLWIDGIPNATLYHYPQRTWHRLPEMVGRGANNGNQRWYGTVTRLADERMLITGGYERADIRDVVPGQPVVHHGTVHNYSVEVWTPKPPPEDSQRAVVSSHLQSPLAIWNPDYTHVFQFPYGPPQFGSNLVLMFGDDAVPVFLNPDLAPGTGWMTLPTPRPGVAPDQAPNHGAASVMLPLRSTNGEWNYVNGSVLHAGGGRGSTMERSIDIYDLANGWLQGIDLGVRRRFPATVLLPDGKVMMVSGYDHLNQNPLLTRAHYLDLRPPYLTPFTTGENASSEVRGYHNVALLLPDGRVLIAGGRSRGSDTGDPEDEKPNFRYLYPPYMSPRESPPPRPVIAAVPETIGYGVNFTVEFTGGPASEVVLMGLGSMTHAFDMNQRYVQLEAVAGDSPLQVKGPPNPQTAPPGHYMLFVLNQSRVPSIASVVRVVP